VTEAQLRLFIRQAFAMANREAAVMKRVDPVLLRTMARIRQVIEGGLPDDGIMRASIWKRLQPEVIEALQPLNQQMRDSLLAEITDMAPDVQQEAVAMVQAAPAPQVGAVRAPVGLQQAPVADTVQAILRTEVNGQRLPALFGPSDRSPVSRFLQGNLREVERRVQVGILRGTPTKDIADEMAVLLVRNGREYLSLKGAGAAAAIRRDAMAITRTAIQDANRQVKEEVYKANADALSGLEWEWVAALDSRTCPTCAPIDGQRWKRKADAPTWPRHVNCRCQVVPVDPDEAASIRGGQVVSPERFTGPRAYKTKVNAQGEKLYRKGVDVKGTGGKPPTYADFLAQSNEKTRQVFFGGGNAGSIRAARFQSLVKAGHTPQEALKKLVVGDGFKPIDKLPTVAKPAVVKPKPAAVKPKPAAVKPKSAPVAPKAPAPKPAAPQAKAPPSKPLDLQAIFDDQSTTRSLGRGMFGEARQTPYGIAKRGWLSKTEMEALERLKGTGFTPMPLGVVYEEGDWNRRVFPGMTVRRGTLLMEKAPGGPVHLQDFSKQEANTAFDKLMQARAAIHRQGIAHQDMHAANVLYDKASERLTVIDLGVARLDSRAALIEGLGTRRGRIHFGKIEQPGDYQSRSTFQVLNKGSALASNPTWKRFQANRKKVEALLAAEGLDPKALSIRTIPRAFSAAVSPERAAELVEMLYDGL
jgi:SPP1 gp7 family putative phage head morphogenesis protein